MKKLLLLPILLLLSGCVTYYYPETAIEDGVYYAEDDPAYNNNAYSYTYAGAAYYPWWSMDYFYLGYGPYTGYRFGYGGYWGSGFSIGFSYGYSPWYYPYYGYYSPWYRPHHHHYYRYRGYCPHYNACGHKKGKNHRGDRHDRYVRNDHADRRNRGEEDGQEDPADRRDRRNGTGSYSTSPMRRYVSATPSGYSGNQGMVVRNRETTKTGKSRIEPVKSKPVETVGVTSTEDNTAMPEIRSQRGNRAVRYRSGSKQGRSRTGPVEPSGPGQIALSPNRPVSDTGNRTSKRVTEPTKAYRSRQGSGEVRYRSGSKQGRSRTTPVRSQNNVPVAAKAPRTVAIPTSPSSKARSAPVQSSGKRPGGSTSKASPPRTQYRSSGTRSSGASYGRSRSTPSYSGGSRNSSGHNRSGSRKNRH